MRLYALVWQRACDCQVSYSECECVSLGTTIRLLRFLWTDNPLGTLVYQRPITNNKGPSDNVKMIGKIATDCCNEKMFVNLNSVDSER